MMCRALGDYLNKGMNVFGLGNVTIYASIITLSI